MDLEKKLIKAEQLFQNKKYQKARDIIKKINAKHPSTQTLLLEATCQFHLNNFIMAQKLYETVIKTEQNSSLLISTLDNLGSCFIKQQKIEQAKIAYVKAVKLDPTYTTKSHRRKACELAHQQSDSDTVLELAPRLLSYADQTTFAFFILLHTSLSTKDLSTFNLYHLKLCGEAKALNSGELLSFIELYNEFDEKEKLSQLLKICEPKFKHLSWFKNALKTKTPLKSTPSNFERPSSQVIGNDPELVELITNLIQHSESQGAHFDDDLFIYCNDGELALKAFNTEIKKLISIPVSCMPLLRDYDIKIENEKFVAKPLNEQINPSANKTMELTVAIYNQCDKVKSWKKVCPFFALREHPSLLTKLTNVKSSSPKISMFKKLFDDNQNNKLFIETFFGSRAFTFGKDTLEKSGTNPTKSELGLLSVIDYLNHRMGGANYATDNSNICVSAMPDENSKEVFVEYNLFDPLLTYLIYGFVDKEAPLIYSIPLTLTTSNNYKINVEGRSGRLDNKYVNDSNRHGIAYLPKVSQSSELTFDVDKLVIPTITDNEHTLIESLTSVLKAINPTILDNELQNEIDFLTKQLIVENRKYYFELESELSKAVSSGRKLSKSALNDIQAIIESSQKGLTNYANSHSIPLF